MKKLITSREEQRQVEVIVNNEKQNRPVDSYDMESGLYAPEITSDEEIFRTLTGEIYLIKNVP